MLRHPRIAAASLVAATLAACSPPQAPDEERRPEPQATQAVAPGPAATVGNADDYKARARAAAKAAEDAARQESAAVEAATR